MAENIIKESFRLTNKNIVLATPLILFSLISSLYLLFSINGNVFSIACSLILLTLMLVAFWAGWTKMLKQVVNNTIDTNDSIKLLKEFPAGVGEYFLSFLGAIFVISLISLIFLSSAYIIGMKYIGDIGINESNFNGLFASTAALRNFLESLTPEQMTKLQLWNLLISCTITIKLFLIMFYIPAISYKSKNPFKALIYSLKDLFSRKFFKNVSLFLFIFVTYFILSILITILSLNPITHIFTIINFYYIIYIAILVFNYYYNNFIKIGSYIDKTI